MKELRLRARLHHHEVGSSIFVEVPHGGATLLAINFHTAVLSAHRSEVPLAVTAQPQPATRIQPRLLDAQVEKVLREKYVFTPVAIEVCHAHTKHGRPLRFGGESACLEASAAVQQEDGGQGVHRKLLR